MGGEELDSEADRVVRGLVERTPCRVWTMCPLSVSSAAG